MYPVETKQRFVELCAEGMSFAKIAEELGVSKPTLIAWSKEYAIDVQNLRETKLEEIREKYYASHKERVEAIGSRFKAMLDSINMQEFKWLDVDKKLSLLLKYGTFLRREERAMKLLMKRESAAEQNDTGETIEWTA